jgi:hypothetical protein
MLDDYADVDTAEEPRQVCFNPTCQLCFPDHYQEMSPKQKARIDKALDEQLRQTFGLRDLGGEGGGA